MKSDCERKHLFLTEAEAERECNRLRRTAKKSGNGGRSFKRLHVYACGSHFHIGRANSYAKLKPLEPRKIPSHGQLMKRLKRIDERLLNELKHRAYVLGQIIEADARRDYEAALAAIYGSAPENGRSTQT
jgi:hypothetical protein